MRLTLSYRDVEELLADRGIQVSYEIVRRWVLKFGPVFACNLRRLRPRASDTWPSDEMVVSTTVQIPAEVEPSSGTWRSHQPGATENVRYRSVLPDTFRQAPEVS